MNQEVKLLETSNLLFSLKDVTYTPVSPRMKEPFIVKGKVELFGLLFLAPIWVIAKVTYPENWWEEIIPIWGSPTVGEGQMALGGDFEIDFPKGFDREGEYALDVEVHLGPTYTLDSTTLPPFPPLAEYKATFFVVGEAEEIPTGFKFSAITIDGHVVTLTNHDADSGLLLQKTTADYLSITPAWEWTGPSKSATISVKVGYRDLLGGFSPKTSAYTAAITLPNSPTTPYHGTITTPITVPLANCGGLTDGAIEIVLKVSGISDYISRVWNVYTTIVGTETLEVDITPTDGGYVMTNPAPVTGPSKWYNDSTGQFNYGTKVQVTAYPNPAYKFDHWSDEIEGGVSYTNPAYVKPMTEYRAVKAHFREEAVAYETLEVDITPEGSGYVKTSPASKEGKSTWYHNDKGTFPYGTNVQVTAYPNSGYKFDHWSDEIVGGVSYSNPEYVKPMTEYRAVKAHFRETVIGISFYARPWGTTPDCSNPKAWTCYYWDPATSTYVGDGQWHNLPSTLKFSNVQPGGALWAKYLGYDNIASEGYFSEYFDPINGATYQFELATGIVYKV